MELPREWVKLMGERMGERDGIIMDGVLRGWGRRRGQAKGSQNCRGERVKMGSLRGGGAKVEISYTRTPYMESVHHWE